MALGIVAALHARESTGHGQKIDVSMQEAVLGFMVGTMHEHFTGNRVGTPPTPVADGFFTLRTPPLSDSAWQQLATTIDREELATDPRFATGRERLAHQAEIDDIVASWARNRTRQEVWDSLKDIGYFGSMVLTLGEVLEDPHIKARRAFVEREHPTAGHVTLLAPWIHMTETPSGIRSVAPLVGEHTAEVLGGILELTPDEIETLRAQSVIV
jgi:crotonobetainyl-CoA:carnitine CoA-transferase CaiB-like acyl-CoA transferase